MKISNLAATLLLAMPVFGQKSTYCPVPGTCITVNIPSHGSSNLFFQITSPSTMSYVAFGQGTKMAGSNMFIIYSNLGGQNVTLSPRSSNGHTQPTSNSSSTLTLLAGSGISGGVMTANVLCTNCQSWTGGSMDFTSTSSSWIYGYKNGSSLNSNSVSAIITKHDKEGTFVLDLATATGGNSLNPFISSSSVTSGNSSSSTSVAAPGTGGSSNNAAEKNRDMMIAAHGIIGGIAFVILFPLGAIVLRVLNFPGLIWLHVCIQCVAYAASVAVFALGVVIALNEDEITLAHPVLGIVVVGALFFQPLLGVGHHLLYKSRGRQNIFTGPHLWWGRLFITLGIINGALGIKLTEGTVGPKLLAYIIVAVIIYIVWMTSTTLAWKRKRTIVLESKDEHSELTSLDRVRGDASKDSGIYTVQ